MGVDPLYGLHPFALSHVAAGYIDELLRHNTISYDLFWAIDILQEHIQRRNTLLKTSLQECEFVVLYHSGDRIKRKELLFKGVVLVDPELDAVARQQFIDPVGVGNQIVAMHSTAPFQKRK